jgi:PAS domain S-box-containing protein
MPPNGILVGNASDLVALTIFSAMGVFMSVVAELYRRSRQRAAAYQKELALRDKKEALRQSETQFQTLANAIPQLCWMANSDGWIFWYNERWYEYTGTTPEQMEGWGWQSVHDPKVLANVLERWKASIASGQPFDMVFPLRGADGVFRPFLTRVMPVKDAEDRVARWFGTNTDISEQRASEDAMRQALEHRRLALEAAELGTWDYRFDVGEVFWDESCRNMFGVPSGKQIDYDGAIACIHPEDRTAVNEAVRRAIAETDGGAYHREYRVIWPDGSIHWIASHGRAYFDGEGEQRRALRFIGVNMDITERKQTEDALRASEVRWAITLRSIGDAVMTTDAAGRVTFLNPVAEALTGWQTAEAQGHPSQEVFHIINELNGEPAADIVSRVLQERRMVALANHTALVTKGGQTIPIEDSAAPIYGAAGNILGMVLVFHDVTEKRQAQEALRANEARYRALIELSPVAILVHRKNRIEFANPAACELFGASAPEQLYDKTVFDVFHPDCHPIIRERIQSLLQGHRAPLLEEKIMQLNGTIREGEVVASPFVDQAGTAIQVIVRDITERKQKQQQLEKLTRTLKALNNSNEALLHARSEAALLQQVCTIVTKDCGYSMVWIGFAEDDEEKTVRPVAHAGFDEGYLETLRITWSETERGRGPTGTAIRTGQPSMCRNMLTDSKFEPWRGEARKRGYASSLVLPLKTDGQTFGAFTIYSGEPDPFSPDEIKLLEELAADLSFGISALRLRTAHERIEEALRQSEERLRVAATAGDIGMWNWNPQSGEVVVSANWRCVFGVAEDENVTFDTWLNAVHPDDRERALSALIGAKEQRQEYSVEYRVVWPSGEVRWLVDRGRASYDENGQALNMAGVNVDITDRKRAEAALVQSEKLASVGRMAASIAHEINNPLAAVMNTLFLAQTSAGVPDSVQRYLEVADEELRRISHITRQTLGFYREASVATTVPLSTVLDSAVNVLQSKIKAKHATVEKQYDDHLEITAISGELRQVFSNLLLNSLDAMGENGIIKLRASRSSCRSGEACIRVTIADNGKGIPPAFRTRVFEALFTTKGSTGTGLGLWVTRQIVEEHGGSIRFRSSADGQNKGTVFSVVLPVKPGGAEVARARAQGAS